MTEQLHFHFSLSCIGEGNGNPLQCSCWRIPGMGETGGLPSMGSHRVGHDWSDLAAAAAAEHSLALPFFGIGMKTDFFQSCGHWWVFQICWHIECSTFTESSFRIWNSSTGIPSPSLALLVMLPKSCPTLVTPWTGVPGSSAHGIL